MRILKSFRRKKKRDDEKKFTLSAASSKRFTFISCIAEKVREDGDALRIDLVNIEESMISSFGFFAQSSNFNLQWSWCCGHVLSLGTYLDSNLFYGPEGTIDFSGGRI